MNVYECNGTNIFMRWKMKCSIQRGEVELNGTFHLSPNENICTIAPMKNIHYLFYMTAKSIFFNKTKLTMFSQNLLRSNRGKLWTHHAWLAYSARYMNLFYALTTALRHDTHLATAYFSTKKGNRAIAQNAWDQKCTANDNYHWIEQITNVTWHSMNQSRNKDLFSCYIK